MARVHPRRRAAQTQSALAPLVPRRIVPAVITSRACLVSVFLGIFVLNLGCTTQPMTYSQWQQELARRKKMAETGLPYKSQAQIKREASEMRTTAEQGATAEKK